jgi:hypothetical protein
VLAASAVVALIGALAAAILFFAGVGKAETAVAAFMLVCIAVTVGTPAFVDGISKWGVPGDEG